MEKAALSDHPTAVQVEELLRNAMLANLAQAPAHIRRLGQIVRRSVETGRLTTLRRFLHRHGIKLKASQIVRFRDYLITRRLDLKDLEPAARARLRLETLAAEEPGSMTADYRAAVEEGRELHCRDCRWFVTAPNDETETGAKSCVELGTKGADLACHGFFSRQ